MENRSSQPITDLHAGEDAERERAHHRTSLLFIFSSKKIKYLFKYHSKLSSNTEVFAGLDWISDHSYLIF